ncbi:MAG: hypothetical protein ACXW2E_00815 [Nitrososphaeraceae archaeon]
MASYNYYQSTASSTWTITHELNTKFVAIDTMKLVGNGVYEKLLPESVQIIDDNSILVTFSNAIAGRARIVS